MSTRDLIHKVTIKVTKSRNCKVCISGKEDEEATNSWTCGCVTRSSIRFFDVIPEPLMTTFMS